MLGHHLLPHTHTKKKNIEGRKAQSRGLLGSMICWGRQVDFALDLAQLFSNSVALS